MSTVCWFLLLKVLIVQKMNMKLKYKRLCQQSNSQDILHLHSLTDGLLVLAMSVPDRSRLARRVLHMSKKGP